MIALFWMHQCSPDSPTTQLAVKLKKLHNFLVFSATKTLNKQISFVRCFWQFRRFWSPHKNNLFSRSFRLPYNEGYFKRAGKVEKAS